MIKGVNHQVVEVNQTQSEYFERILFFVKPEYASLSEGKLRDRAGIIASGAVGTVRTKKNKSTLNETLKITLSMLCGVALGIILCNMIK